MKRMKTRFLFLALTALLVTSCEGFIDDEDPADKFVGLYSVKAHTTVEAFGFSDTRDSTGELDLAKKSDNTLRTYGYFETTGTVSDGNTINFLPCSGRGADGSYNYQFESAYLMDDVLSIIMTSSTHIYVEGVTLAARVRTEITATKVGHSRRR